MVAGVGPVWRGLRGAFSQDALRQPLARSHFFFEAGRVGANHRLDFGSSGQNATGGSAICVLGWPALKYILPHNAVGAMGFDAPAILLNQKSFLGFDSRCGSRIMAVLVGPPMQDARQLVCQLLCRGSAAENKIRDDPANARRAHIYFYDENHRS